MLVGLVCGEGVIVLWCLGLAVTWLLLRITLCLVVVAAVVACVALWVGGVVLSVNLALLTVLEAACLWWTVRVLSLDRCELLRTVSLALVLLLRVSVRVVVCVAIGRLLLGVALALLAVALVWT